MAFLYYLIIFVHIVACLFLIAVVLLQQGKGQDLASAFGGGGTQTAFGPRGSATVLSRATTILAGPLHGHQPGALADPAEPQRRPRPGAGRGRDADPGRDHGAGERAGRPGGARRGPGRSARAHRPPAPK